MTAISIMMHEELIAFPSSMIKSPGGLLRKVKTEDSHSSTSSSIGTPMSTNTSIASDTEVFSKTPRKYYREISDFSVSFKSMLSSSVTSTAQESIVKELNQLPHSFVVSLRLKIVLADSSSFAEEKHIIRSADLKSSQKIKERLYSIIFSAFLNKFSKVPSMWSKITNKDNTSQNMSEEMIEFNEMMRERELECSFFAVMMNKKYSKALNIVKFKELLVELDPASFTSEWFKEHNKELKKGYRVRFSEEYTH